MKTVVIFGSRIDIAERNKSQLKGLSIGDALLYRFYDGIFHGVSLLFVEPNGDVASPRALAITSDRLYKNFGLPVVFILEGIPAYERQRLIDKDVYFVISDKYAYLPMLMANERLRKTRIAKRLSPVAQYLLLFHLQVESLDGMTAGEIKTRVPYSYPSVTLGITCLEDLGLCKKEADGSKRKIVRFNDKGRRLWDDAQPLLMDPVEKRVFCDEFFTEKLFPVCGINALSHYTMLNPDPERIIMMSAKQFRELESSGAIVRPNVFDGNVVIEVWKYPPVAKDISSVQWVDRLSLAITLREDRDPRVEKEVERLIDEIEWKA